MRTSITTARLALAGAVAFTVLGGPLLTLRASAVHDDAAQTAAAAAPAPAVPQTTVNDAVAVPQGDAGAADDAVSHDPSEPAVVDDELPPATAVAEPTRPDGDDVPQDDVAEAAPGSDEDEPGVPSSPTPDDAESAAEVSAPVVTSVAPTGPAVDEATPAASLTDDGTLPLTLSLDGCTVSVGVAPSVPVGALLTLEDSWTYQFQGSVQPGQAVTFVLGADSQIDPSTGYAVQAHLTAPGGYDELAARAFDVTACINPDAEMASLQVLAEATGDPPDNDVAVDIFSAPDCNGDQAYFVTSVTIDYGTFAVLDVPATDLCISPERLTEADSVDVVGGTSVSFGPDLQASRTIVVAWPLAPKPGEPPVQPDSTVPGPTAADATLSDSTVPDSTVPDPTVAADPTDAPARESGDPSASTLTSPSTDTSPLPSSPARPLQRGQLPQTGTSLTLAVIAAVLLATGVALLRLGRRRQRTPS